MNKRLALVVGINEYAYLDNLSTAAKDAEEVAQLLMRWGNFDVIRLPIAPVEGGKCQVSPKGQVMADNLETAIANLFNPPPHLAPLTALLYFSGHGGRDNLGDKTEGYLLAHDANPRTKDGYFSLKRLRQILQDSPVRQQIIILDCCYSGELFNFAEDELGGEQQGRSRCFITASLPYQSAYERGSENHSLLTEALLKGLNPEGKKGNCVTSYSLADFIRQELKGAPQVPVCASPGSEITLTATNPVLADICPYKGLQYFDDTDRDAEFFKGRSTLTGELIEKVKSSNFLAVLGASGSGKSSVVRAGLLHKLKQGALRVSQGWKYAVMTPGEHPLESLEKALASLIPQRQGVRVLLVVDQFEEVFTLCEDDTKRQQFFECLMAAVNPTGKACGAESLDASPLQGLDVCAILVMRSDFFGKCTEREYAGLAKQIEQHLVIVLPMTEAELREAIEEPTKQVRLEIEPELVQRMIADVKGSPGSLPLLQYALLLLWEGRTVHLNRLTEGAYTQLGGVSGTLQKRADEVYYTELKTEQEKLAAKQIFLALTQVGQDTEDTRRQVLKSDLVSEQQTEAQVQEVLDKLVAARLVVISELAARREKDKKVTVVNIAHEALIRHWQQLRQWLDENREALLRKQKIQEDAEEWRDNGKPDDPAYLLKGAKLDV